MRSHHHWQFFSSECCIVYEYEIKCKILSTAAIRLTREKTQRARGPRPLQKTQVLASSTNKTEGWEGSWDRNSLIKLKIFFIFQESRLITRLPGYAAHHNVFYMIICLCYILFPPWSRVLQKLTGSQLVTNFPTYGTRSFITTFTSARHLSLS